MSIVDLQGRSISSTKKAAQAGAMTQAQAGAVVISEIDIAIIRFNQMALEQHKDNPENAPKFEIKFDKYAYAEAVREKTSLFGYGELSITVTNNGVAKKIYSKAHNARSESDLENTNGYYPDIVFDCMGFLLASGLMYNLALTEHTDGQTEQDTNLQSGDISKDKPRTRNTRKSNKTGN